MAKRPHEVPELISIGQLFDLPIYLEGMGNPRKIEVCHPKTLMRNLHRVGLGRAHIPHRISEEMKAVSFSLEAMASASLLVADRQDLGSLQREVFPSILTSFQYLSTSDLREIRK
jgi:hypothetical protein